jgi:hypothetical protein
MPTPHVLAAVGAMAAVNDELANDGLAGNFRLELLVEMILDDSATASGTLFRQSRLKGFIDLGGRRWRPMAVWAVVLALFAAGFLGLGLGFTFGERRRLPLGRAFNFLEPFLEIANGVLQLFNQPIPGCQLLFEQLVFVEQPLDGVRVHADLDSDGPCQLPQIIGVFKLLDKRSLNKHGKV